MRIVFLIMILLTLSTTGCTEKNPPHYVGTPVVSQEQAKEVAETLYKIKDVKKIELRHLEEVELEGMPSEAKNLNPIYYVISGKNADGTQTIAYVSSGNPEHHFQILYTE
ncbi:hypothetical protein [Ammoniphilus sp. YIM 78166]|uniref:hypothetical protein n=1 Tax=Ammoniphilus sp. YIM 78166 TaxID=1644106 RepID=UPI00106FB4A5|nr:hypothetical protein [Ammoniphilus sp. YIM 78166]